MGNAEDRSALFADTADDNAAEYAETKDADADDESFDRISAKDEVFGGPCSMITRPPSRETNRVLEVWLLL